MAVDHGTHGIYGTFSSQRPSDDAFFVVSAQGLVVGCNGRSVCFSLVGPGHKALHRIVDECYEPGGRDSIVSDTTIPPAVPEHAEFELGGTSSRGDTLGIGWNNIAVWR